MPKALTLGLVLLVAAPAGATTAYDVEKRCPVCGNSVTTVEIGSTNNLGGQDADFFRRAAGDIPLFLVATTCSSCRYSGYPADFLPADASPDAGAALAPESSRAVKALRSKPSLAVPNIPEWAQPSSAHSEHGKSSALPAWARLDLIAQTRALGGAPQSELGDAWLRCAWGVRYEANPFEAHFQRFPEGVLPRPGKGERKNPSDEDIELALALLPKLPTLEPKARRSTAAGIGYLLRTRGEHEALLAALPALGKAFPADVWAKLEPEVRASIALERSYQSRSLAAFQQALAGRQEKPEERASLLFLTGELHRRLGAWDLARAQYDAATSAEGKPKWIDALVKKQRAALDRDAAQGKKR